MRTFLCVLILCVFLGCKDNKSRVDKANVDSLIKSKELTSFQEALVDTTIFKSYSIIPLETTSESLFREIDRISAYKDRIYLFDNRLEKILIFDDKGKYINKIHNIGQGPQEYNAVIDFCLDEKNDEILVLCDRPYKLMRFSKDGEFITEKPFLYLYRSISMDSDYIFCELYEYKKHEIGIFDKEFDIIDSGLTKLENANFSCYNGGKSLVKSKSLYYARRFDSSIYRLTKDSIEKKHEFDFGKYKLPKEFLYGEDCAIFFEKVAPYIYSITNVVESDKYIMFSTNLGICLYNKETNELNGYRMLLNQDLKSGSNIYYPNEGSGNSIIASLEPASLKYYKGDSAENSATINKLIDTLKEDDNPILIIYEFK